MKNLTKKQAKKFAQMYVAGLAWHHTLTVNEKLGDNDIDNINSEINSIVSKITPVEDILAGTNEILNYVRTHF